MIYMITSKGRVEREHLEHKQSRVEKFEGSRYNQLIVSSGVPNYNFYHLYMSVRGRRVW